MSVSSQVDAQSRPWDDTEPFAAGRSSRALTPPSQAVAPVTGVNVRGGRFNNSANANNNFSLSLFNLILGPRDNAAPSGVQSEFPSSTYSRLLLPRACGFPLYDPQPPGWLNREYRSEGVRIGDVGIITTEGNFDYLFNICHTADHPINRRGVPDGFSPPQWATDIEFTPENCRDPGDYVINGSVQALESERTSGDYRFKGSLGEAAVLVIPTPTIKAHAPNTRDFLDYAAQNAVAWYKFGTEGLRRDIPNGSIYLITGWEKTQSWGTASFEGNKYDFEMAYRNNTWAQYGSASAKRGPRDVSVPHPAPFNQCIFLNGYKVSAVGNTATKVSSSGSGSSMGTGALGGSLARWLYQFGQNQGGSAGKPGLGIEQNESNMVVLESINPATSEDVHPSNLINRFLLNRVKRIGLISFTSVTDHPTMKVPEADVAITHDDVWCSLVKDPYLPFQNQIEALYTISSQNGAVYLTKQSRKRSFATDSERSIITTYSPKEDSLTREPALTKVRRVEPPVPRFNPKVSNPTRAESRSLESVGAFFPTGQVSSFKPVYPTRTSQSVCGGYLSRNSQPVDGGYASMISQPVYSGYASMTSQPVYDGYRTSPGHDRKLPVFNPNVYNPTWADNISPGPTASFGNYETHAHDRYSSAQNVNVGYPSRTSPGLGSDDRKLPPLNTSSASWTTHPSSYGAGSDSIRTPTASYPPEYSYSSHGGAYSYQTRHGQDTGHMSMGHSNQVSHYPESDYPRSSSPPYSSSSRSARPMTRSSSPPPISPISGTDESNTIKKKRKRADANQLKVLNDTYNKTAFPSTEERQRLAKQLDMSPRSVQIWFQSKRQSMRQTQRQSSPAGSSALQSQMGPSDMIEDCAAIPIDSTGYRSNSPDPYKHSQYSQYSQYSQSLRRY